MPEVASPIQNLRALSLLYSSSTFRDILRNNNLCSIKNRVNKYKNCLTYENNDLSFKVLLSLLYDSMVKNYCNEYIYKNTIVNEELIKKYGLIDTVLLNEYKVNKSIADLILINGEVKIFEVKTDLDKLIRLPSQIRDYQKVADKIYVVTNGKYIENLLEIYGKSDIGIVEFNNNSLITHKIANTDRSKFCHETIFKLLRKQEYLNIINNEFGYIPKIANTLIFKECLHMIKFIEINKFQQLAFNQLKYRKLHEPNLLLDNQTPIELKFLCHSLNMNNDEYHNLFQLLNKKI